jgi:glycerophosphoryl diester phosphodiesterase
MRHPRLLAALGIAVAALWSPALVDAIHFRRTDSERAASFASEYPWTNAGHVAHALGSGIYRNSRRAFDESYEAGFRVFEVDLAFTSDGHLVVSHGWLRPPTLAEFMADRADGPLTARDFLQIAADRPEAWFILDPKDDPATVWRALVDEAKRNPEVLDRLIPQLLHPSEFSETLEIHPFRSLVLTTGRLAGWSRAVVDWALRHHVQVITIEHESSDEGLIGRIEAGGGWVYAHPVNDCRTAAGVMGKGVHRVYTGLLGPDPDSCEVVRR